MTMAAVERQHSIEMEPRTLTFQQLECAREAALYVSQTKTLEEALAIFTEGLKPVTGVARRCRIPHIVSGYHDDDDEEEWDDGSRRRIELPPLKDAATSPF